MAEKLVYQMVCSSCGTVGFPKTYTKGSIWIELLLWLCFIVPGVAYSVWRLASRYKGCPACQAPNMIPTNSPIGREILSTRSGS